MEATVESSFRGKILLRRLPCLVVSRLHDEFRTQGSFTGVAVPTEPDVSGLV